MSGREKGQQPNSIQLALRRIWRKVLVIDIGGTHVKVLVTGEQKPRKFASGPYLTPSQMVTGVKKITPDWKYDAVSIGFPGLVLRNRPVAEPCNLGQGWVGFNFQRAFGCPVKLVNDAVMQAIGSYSHGKMLFLGLGTGFGSALIADGIVEPMELGHLPYKKGTYESYVGNHALLKLGRTKWCRHVADVVTLLTAALEPDEVVIGGGNAKELEELPGKCRLGDNRNAFTGGFRLWEETPKQQGFHQLSIGCDLPVHVSVNGMSSGNNDQVPLQADYSRSWKFINPAHAEPRR